MGPLIRTTLLGIALVLAAATRVSAQASPLPAPDTAKIPLSRIPRVHRAPKLEDFLENQPREAELAVTDFRQNSPGDGTAATEPTTAYLSYDDKNLYVVFVCQDESGTVRVHLSRREGSDQDDGVGVLLDTFRDFHRADRKSTRLNSSHSQTSYAVFCLKKKKKTKTTHYYQNKKKKKKTHVH